MTTLMYSFSAGEVNNNVTVKCPQSQCKEFSLS